VVGKMCDDLFLFYFLYKLCDLFLNRWGIMWCLTWLRMKLSVGGTHGVDKKCIMVLVTIYDIPHDADLYNCHVEYLYFLGLVSFSIMSTISFCFLFSKFQIRISDFIARSYDSKFGFFIISSFFHF
jgi:hypothetical protein